MLYLAATASHLTVPPDVGLMIGPRTRGLGDITTRRFGIDCDAYTGHFDHDAYLRHLERLLPHAERALFCVVPDLPGDAEGTFSAFLASAPLFAEFGYPLAYVAQDGAEQLDLPPCECLFLAGSDAWRTRHAEPLVQRAREAGVRWVHVGRVNSASRVRACAQLGADSVDGTYLAFRGVAWGLRDITGWLSQAHHPRLF